MNNECVMITNHYMHKNEEDTLQDKVVQNNYISSYYSQMWATKYFGVYHKDSHGVNPSSIYVGYGDTNVKRFAKKELDKNEHISTLDQYTNLDPNCGLQYDNFKCGI